MRTASGGGAGGRAWQTVSGECSGRWGGEQLASCRLSGQPEGSFPPMIVEVKGIGQRFRVTVPQYLSLLSVMQADGTVPTYFHFQFAHAGSSRNFGESPAETSGNCTGTFSAPLPPSPLPTKLPHCVLSLCLSYFPVVLSLPLSLSPLI